MKKLYNIILLNTAVILSLIINIQIANSAIPITTDSRIKTFVYNENEVFHIALQYGYQSNIEFAKNEEIETISIGNSYSWKIDAVGRRIFIKPLEGNAHTNMTVITNKRTYQIELESKYPDDNLDEDLVYVVRFFYPSESFDKPLPDINNDQFKPEVVANTNTNPLSKFNFNYSLTGPDSIAPVKVFDDGQYTFLKFANNNSILPHMFVVGSNGTENRVRYSRQNEYIVIKQVVKKLALRMNQDVVFVFNES